MYKRAARVVYVCEHNNGYSILAQAWAAANATDWLEARSAGFELHAIPEAIVTSANAAAVEITSKQQVLTPELIEWADLVVTLSDKASELLAQLSPTMPVGTQHKQWKMELFDPTHEIDNIDHFRDAIFNKVQCMVGGMKMMSRLNEDDCDDSDDDGDSE